MQNICFTNSLIAFKSFKRLYSSTHVSVTEMQLQMLHVTYL